MDTSGKLPCTAGLDACLSTASAASVAPWSADSTSERAAAAQRPCGGEAPRGRPYGHHELAPDAGTRRSGGSHGSVSNTQLATTTSVRPSPLSPLIFLPPVSHSCTAAAKALGIDYHRERDRAPVPDVSSARSSQRSPRWSRTANYDHANVLRSPTAPLVLGSGARQAEGQLAGAAAHLEHAELQHAAGTPLPGQYQ